MGNIVIKRETDWVLLQQRMVCFLLEYCVVASGVLIKIFASDGGSYFNHCTLVVGGCSWQLSFQRGF